jgi:hypothetical protein
MCICRRTSLVFGPQIPVHFQREQAVTCGRHKGPVAVRSGSPRCPAVNGRLWERLTLEGVDPNRVCWLPCPTEAQEAVPPVCPGSPRRGHRRRSKGGRAAVLKPAGTARHRLAGHPPRRRPSTHPRQRRPGPVPGDRVAVCSRRTPSTMTSSIVTPRASKPGGTTCASSTGSRLSRRPGWVGPRSRLPQRCSRPLVATIKEIVNVALLQGNIGKPGAGLCPVRGHSNVQGDRTMGIWEKLPEHFGDSLREEFGFEPPRRAGAGPGSPCRSPRSSTGLTSPQGARL